MRVFRSFDDVSAALRDIDTKINSLRGGNDIFDLKDRRIVNLAHSIDNSDAVTKEELTLYYDKIASLANDLLNLTEEVKKQRGRIDYIEKILKDNTLWP